VIGGTADDTGPKFRGGRRLKVSSEGGDGLVRSLAQPGAQKRSRKLAVTKSAQEAQFLTESKMGREEMEGMYPRVHLWLWEDDSETNGSFRAIPHADADI
jgi:hypothetical protein